MLLLELLSPVFTFSFTELSSPVQELKTKQKEKNKAM